MDPRTSSKVTSPDLLTAFAEGRGDAGEAPPDSGKSRIWLVLFTDPDGADATFVFQLDEWDKVFEEVQRHMAKGVGRGAAMVISETEPDLYNDAQQDISQIDG